LDTVERESLTLEAILLTDWVWLSDEIKEFNFSLDTFLIVSNSAENEKRKKNGDEREAEGQRNYIGSMRGIY
jgi:hypothetical protein